MRPFTLDVKALCGKTIIDKFVESRKPEGMSCLDLIKNPMDEKVRTLVDHYFA
jgi:hypothetical protein